MKPTPLHLIAFAVIVIAACSPSKKSTSTAVAPPPAANAAPPTAVFSVAKSADGIYEPGNAELGTLQMKYSDVTMEKLKEGHQLYTKGACINCHGTKSIYLYNEPTWKVIIDDMAKKAEITDSQKDAVYKYVLAIKATQGK